MTGLKRRWIVPLFVLAVAALASGVWRYGYLQALDQIARRADSDLALASDRLSTQLQGYRELAVLLADHPALARVSDPVQARAASLVLRDAADKSGARDVIFADTTGQVRATARGGGARSVAGAPHFERGMQGALGAWHGTAPGGARIYVHAAPAFGPGGGVRGVLILEVDVENMEQAWRGDSPAVFFTDAGGEVFVTNRSELLFWRQRAEGTGLAPTTGPAPAFSATTAGPHDIWHLDWGPYLPKRALHLAGELPVIGLTGAVLLDTAPARRLALLQAAAVAAICLAFGALLFLATERRRTLAQANAALEARVQERTAALSQTNAQLRREVREREEAEAALKQAQADLVQAGKLSALGQMSAGISHELNQPLMAIRSFAENGQQFLERGRVEVAGENLGRISDLARRMGRIIQNLRAFVRNEAEPVSKVDLVHVVEAALELTAARLRSDGVVMDWRPPATPVFVRGGEVRLSQVFVNLINNAADAMAGQAERHIRIAIEAGPAAVTVTVRDQGPGITAPEKLFEPFYTTKAVGSGEGMGLGLSISYGLVQSFGGRIRGVNVEDGGGAMFIVELDHWRDEERAA